MVGPLTKLTLFDPQFLSKRVNAFYDQSVRLLTEIFLRSFDGNTNENVIGKVDVSSRMTALCSSSRKNPERSYFLLFQRGP